MIQVGQPFPDVTVLRSDGASWGRQQLLGQSTVVRVSRHPGCPICQMDLVDLARDHDRLKAAGLAITVILEAEPKDVQPMVTARKLPYLVLADHQRRLYDALGASAGTLLDFVHPAAALKAARATARGFMHGRCYGNELQVPLEVIVDAQGVVRFARRGKHIGDVLSTDELIATAKQVIPSPR